MVEMQAHIHVLRLAVRAMDLSIINLCDNFDHNFTVFLKCDARVSKSKRYNSALFIKLSAL